MAKHCHKDKYVTFHHGLFFWFRSKQFVLKPNIVAEVMSLQMMVDFYSCFAVYFIQIYINLSFILWWIAVRSFLPHLCGISLSIICSFSKNYMPGSTLSYRLPCNFAVFVQVFYRCASSCTFVFCILCHNTERVNEAWPMQLILDFNLSLVMVLNVESALWQTGDRHRISFAFCVTCLKAFPNPETEYQK